MVAKNGYLGLLKIKVFRNKGGYDVITSVHDATNKILSCDSDFLVEVTMWPKFGGSSVSIRKNTKISKNLKGFDQKTILHTSAAKGLKLKVKRFRGLITTFIEVTEAGGGGGDLAPPILNRVK